jgi:hypothetical protein
MSPIGCESDRPALSRRQMLSEVANGFGLLALGGLLAEESRAAAPGTDGSTIAPHHPCRAKSVIFLFMDGGPSQLDLFDPKPRLNRDHGKPLPFEKPKLARTTTENLMASPFRFRHWGRSGIEVSELLPGIGSCIDDICVVRSLWADNINHPNACLQMFTGEQVFSRPSLGSWMLYGLGSENRNLPGFVVISTGGHDAALWGSSFLPAAYEGTRIADLQRPIANLGNSRLPVERQRRQLDFLNRLNQQHRQGRDDSRLEARIQSFELAFRMQIQAPDAFDLNHESQEMRHLYGLDDQRTEAFGKQCLLARRLVERGVRFVQLFSPVNWDHHTGIHSQLPSNCAATDRPVAGLLKDLKARGLLQDTLVIWGGEFGRTPVAQKGDGRDHHPFGFTMWLAGGGVKGGIVHGATDEFGWYSVQNKVHVHDLHATILHLLGLDHERLTYRYSGRDYRLTDVQGNVVKDIIS